jgi:hypothetical protein
VANGFAVLQDEVVINFDEHARTVEARVIYIIPRRCKMTRITTMTIRTWIQPPVRGNLGLMLPPKKPSSHRINRITMIVHNMRFLLLNDQFGKVRSPDLAADDLAAQ